MPNARPAQVRVAITVAAALLVGCTPGPSPTLSPSGGGSNAVASEPASAIVGPSLTPTLAPSPPAPIASLAPLRTTVQVSSPVLGRPGVPSDIAAAHWWTGHGDAGQLGTTAQVGLPAGEQIIIVAGGLVLSERRPDAGISGTTHLLIRDFATGTLLRDIPTPITGLTAAIAGGRVFWGGTVFDPAKPDGTDGGVWTVDPRTDSEPLAVLKAGEKVQLVLGGRSRLEVSPSGRTVAAGLIRFDGTARTDFIDVPTLQVRRLNGTDSFATTDTISISDDQGPTDAPYYGYGITATSITSGAVRWRFPGAKDVDKFALQNVVSIESDIFVSYVWQAGSTFEYRVARIDSTTGKAQVLFREDGTHGLWVQLDVSSARHIVLAGDIGPIGELIAGGDIWVSTFDTATGTLTRDAFVIHTPFMCAEDGCRQGG